MTTVFIYLIFSFSESESESWFHGRGFEVLDFTISGHFWFSARFLIAFTCCCRSVNYCTLRWFKAFKRESSNFLFNRKWPDFLKYPGRDPFIQNCDRSERKKGPVFSKLFRLDRTDPLRFGRKFWLNGSRPFVPRASWSSYLGIAG